MTDAHCHVSSGDPSVREILIGRDARGVHPWAAEGVDLERAVAELRARLAEEPHLLVGEIGLDRLRTREVSPKMVELFRRQFALALEFNRPVILHGAKCWGRVVKEIVRLSAGHPHAGVPLLFHGFSRSDGLLPDIVRLNGYISVGPAVLNDHAVNYRALVKKIPIERLLVETDRTEENAATCPSVRDVLVRTAALRGLSAADLEAQTAATAFCLRASPTGD